MRKVTKVLMFVWREKQGEKEFLVLHRPKQKDRVVLTGHKEAGEGLKETAKREVLEELGLKPVEIVDLNFKTEVKIKKKDVLSKEYAFLIKVPNQKVKFLEYKAEIHWYSLKDLSRVLTYPNQAEAIDRIEKIIK